MDRVAASSDFLHVVHIVSKMQEPALGKHHVKVELCAQAFPEFQCVIVNGGGFVTEIVRTHDRCIAPGVAAAKPAFLEHGDIRYPALRGQIIGRRQAVTAAAHDDDVICGFRIRAAPCLRPIAMPGQSISR